MNFHDAAVAFESKSTFELFRGWVVFQTCRIGWVVRNCDWMYNTSIKILGPTLTHGVMRHVLFNHFCAGENSKEIIPKMDHLRRYAVGGILDYAAEAKDEAPAKAEQPINEVETVGAPLSARKYDYAGEKVCDANTDIFLDAIRAVKDATPEGFAAIKLSGLGNPHLLERMSTCVIEMRKLFYRISKDPATQDGDLNGVPFYSINVDFTIDWDTFQTNWPKLFKVESELTLRQMFDKFDTDKDGVISFLEWSENVKLSEINELARSCIHQGPVYKAALDDEEIKLYNNLCNRTTRIMDLAKSLGVRVMIDAEWLDIQPAIDHLVIFLQRIYNKDDPIIFQTYQTYLKGMHMSVLQDLSRSKREGWYFGSKVVRGAYMVSEREKAAKRGVESPICETYEDTEKNYHRTIESILRHNVGSTGKTPGGDSQAEMLLASHNRGSIQLVAGLVEELGKDKRTVCFGQLLGMADHLTFTLAKNGYKAYKYVPYGPIGEVVPYLIRRTQENSAILGSPGVQEERAMVQKELRRRLFGF